MEAEEYDRIAAAEADHWWYRSTRALMADLLSPWLANAGRILDAGCGPGGNGAWLAAHGSVVGMDASSQALAHLARNHPEVRGLQASTERLPAPAGASGVAVT